MAGEIDHAGQFGGLGPGAEGAVLFEGGVPELLGQRADGFAELGGDGVPEGEGGRDAALSEGARRWVGNALALPAMSARMRISVPWRWASGI
ncbi:hypothetical protein [Kitasatospora sp. NPDC088351]|uniref:hypothetical protein n=1 Tax=Kitasatospora sp. NPDC088351 TaxID=3155180 RepID=UPI00342FD559